MAEAEENAPFSPFLSQIGEELLEEIFFGEVSSSFYDIQHFDFVSESVLRMIVVL